MTFTRFATASFVVTLLLLISAPSVTAGIVFSTDRSELQALATGASIPLQLEDFESPSPSSLPATFGGVIITTNSFDARFQTVNANGRSRGLAVGMERFPTTVTFDFSAMGGVHAFGIDFSHDRGFLLRSDISLIVDGKRRELFDGIADQVGLFAGAFSDVRFSTVTFEADGGHLSSFELDNLRYGAVPTPPTGTVPEPASVAVFALGALGTLSRRRRTS